MKQSNKKPYRMILISRDITGLSLRTVQRMARKVIKSFNGNESITKHRN